jgi:hypothetical protein
LVEHQPSKLRVASSSLVSRSKILIVEKCRISLQQNCVLITANIIVATVSVCCESRLKKNKRFFESRRKWLVEYKKTLKCARCGESHPATLAFHHKRRSEKKFEIGNALILKVSFKRLLAEIEKCEVICANCHAKEHLSYLFE